jgi:hypothetical protein
MGGQGEPSRGRVLGHGHLAEFDAAELERLREVAVLKAVLEGVAEKK